jgi:hypothetical protein
VLRERRRWLWVEGRRGRIRLGGRVEERDVVIL